MIKNFLKLLSGEFAGRAFQALGMILLTRQLGKDGVGVYGLAAAIFSYGQLGIMLGLDPIAIRGLHQNTVDAQSATGRIFSLRLLTSSILIALAALYALGGAPAGPVLLVLSLGYLPIALTPRWLLLGVSDVRPLAIASALSQAIFLGVVVFAPHGPVVAAAGAAIAEAAGALVCYVAAREHAGDVKLIWDKEFNRKILRESWPMVISLAMGAMMTNFDVLALKLLGRQDQIGLYVSAYRLLTFFSPFLGLLQNTILPRYAASWPDYGAIRSHVRKLCAVLLTGMTVAALLLTWQAPLVMRLLFGDAFVDGTPLLRVLVWALIPQGLRCVLRQVLYAYRLERSDLRNVQAAVATNVILDFILVPWFGALGCAISTIASETIYFIATNETVRRRTVVPQALKKSLAGRQVP